MVDGLVKVFESVVATTKPILNARVLDHFFIFRELNFVILSLFEILDSLSKPFGIILAKTPPKVPLRPIGVMLDGVCEVLDSKLMIAHILVDNTSSYVNGFVIIYLLNHFSKAFKGFLKFVDSMVHQA